MENNFNELESLRLIRGMIDQARGSINKGAGKYFILWGYIVAAASLAHFIMIMARSLEGFRYVWPAAALVGIAATIFMIIKDRGKTVVRTYVGKMVNSAWIGFGISAVLIYTLLIGGSTAYGALIYPAIGMVYTFALFISARAFGFRWMIWPVSVCALLVLSYKFVPLAWFPFIHFLLMVAGNIVPGHLLNKKGAGNV